MKKLRHSVALLPLLFLAAPAEGAIYLLGTTFSADFPSEVEVYGTGILSYEADEALQNGSYAWDSFLALAVSLTVGGSTFTEQDLLTPSATVYIEVRNGGFLFSNVGGTSVGTGAAAFARGADEFSVQPVAIGYNSTVRFVHENESGRVGGTYAPTPAPEPSSILLGAVGAIALLRRRRP